MHRSRIMTSVGMRHSSWVEKKYLKKYLKNCERNWICESFDRICWFNLNIIFFVLTSTVCLLFFHFGTKSLFFIFNLPNFLLWFWDCSSARLPVTRPTASTNETALFADVHQKAIHRLRSSIRRWQQQDLLNKFEMKRFKSCTSCWVAVAAAAALSFKRGPQSK